MNETLTVLIVEDSETVRKRLCALVDEVGGVRVVGEAGGLREARAALEAVRPDVMVLDLRLGDGNGLELLRELQPPRLVPRVIVLTNEAWPQYRRECLAMGADWFFDKTTEFHRVPEVLAQMSQQARHEDPTGVVEAGAEQADAGDAEPRCSAGTGEEARPAAGGTCEGSEDAGYGTGARMVAAAVVTDPDGAKWA